jgi:hypothetical protein
MYKPLFESYISNGQEKTGLYRKTLLMGGRVVFTAHHDGTEESQDEALRRCDEVAIGLVEQVTAKLGRRPTERELQRGLALPETQDVGPMLRQKAEWDSYFAPKEIEDDPIERAIVQRRREVRGEGDARLSMLQELKEKRMEAETAKEAAKAKAEDPRRPACVEDANAVALATAFDPDCTAADLRRAQFMERLARDGDPLVYQNLRQQHQREELQRRKEKAAPLHEKAATLASEIQRLEKPFILPAATTEFCPGESTALPEGLHLS